MAPVSATPPILIDFDNRIVQFTQREQLAIAPTSIRIPFAVLKEVVGQIVIGEGKAERAQAASQMATTQRPT